MTRYEELFWSKVDKHAPNNCWVWMGFKKPTGYGLFGVGWKRTHRLAWEFTNGKIPAGIHVLHKCDNPSCVNPSHLYLGTHQDNMRDRNKKGRQARVEGEK